MVKARSISGSEFYRKAGFKPIIVHVSAKTHERLASIGKLDGRSLQVVVRAILEQAASEPEKALEIVSELPADGSETVNIDANAGERKKNVLGPIP